MYEYLRTNRQTYTRESEYTPSPEKDAFLCPPQSVGEIIILPFTLHFMLLANMRTGCLSTIHHSESSHFSQNTLRSYIHISKNSS